MDAPRSHARDERQPAGDPRGVEPFRQRDSLLGSRGGAELDPDRVPHAGEELDVGAVELTGAVADPEHVGRAVVGLAGERVRSGQRLLVLEQEALVARPDVDLVQRALATEVDPDRLHEAQRSLDLAGERLVALAGR